MSDSYHYYKCPVKGNPKRLKSITTPPQARGKDGVYPSVTSVLGLLPNPFIYKWKGEKMAKLAREFPDKDMDELNQLAWGTRTCPETGEEIGSAEFGTRAHVAIEEHFSSQFDSPYWPVVKETLQYLTANFIFRYAEKVLCCHDLRIAGTVDYIGTDKDEKWMLGDFKVRDVKNNKPGYYDKDLAQLAVEAAMWKKDVGLDYDPDIYSIVVDANTGTCFPKKWSEKMRRKGLQLAQTASDLYWQLPGYGWVDPEN